MTTYYVSPTGSDSADGTSATTAFKTLAKAQAAMAAAAGADTTLVESGTYSSGATLTAKNDGDTFTADQGAKVVLDGGGRAVTFFALDGAQGVTINGFTMQNTTNVAVMLQNAHGDTISNNTLTNVLNTEEAAITMEDGGGNTITHNSLTNIGYNGVGSWYDDATSQGGPTAGTGGNIISFNYIANAVTKANDGGGIYAFAQAATPDQIFGNQIVGTHGGESFGVYIDDYAVAIVHNNLTENTVTAGLINHGGSGNQFYQNIVVNPGTYGVIAPQIDDDGISETSISFHDNLITGGTFALAASDPQTPSFFTHNMYVSSSSNPDWGFDGNPYSSWTSSGGDAGSQVVNGAGFTNPSGGDYSFASGSPALAFGIQQFDFSAVGASGSSGGDGGTGTSGGSGSSGGGSGNGGSNPPPPPPTGAKVAVLQDGVTHTLTLDHSQTDRGDSFTVNGPTISAVLNNTKQTLAFTNGAGDTFNIRGAGTKSAENAYAKVSLDHGTLNIQAGAGNMEVTAGGDATNIIVSTGKGSIWDDNFRSAVDQVLAPTSMQGHLRLDSYADGQELMLVSGRSVTSLLWMPNQHGFNLAADVTYH